MSAQTRSATTPDSGSVAGPRSLSHEMALRIHALGIVPVRIPFRDKNPARAGWTSERPTPAEIAAWRLPFNVGALCGAASGWYVDIDIDCAEGIELAPHYLPETWVHGRASKPNSHWGYVAKDVRYRKFSDGNDQTVLELRGEASTGSAIHSVWPYSVHASGETVEWSADHGDGMDRPLEIDGRELVSRVCRLARAIIFAREGASIAEARRLERNYQPTPKAKPPTKPRVTSTKVEKGARCFVCGLVAESATGWRTKDTCSNACVVKRARLYVDKMPAAVSGSGGHDATFRVAVVLARDFALDEDTVIEILTEYSQRCDPPWTSAEIKHKAKQAAKKSNELGRLLVTR